MSDHHLLRGVPVRERILNEVRERVASVTQKHALGRLVSICIGEHPEVDVYIRNQAKAAAEVGIPFDEKNGPAN